MWSICIWATCHWSLNTLALLLLEIWTFKDCSHWLSIINFDVLKNYIKSMEYVRDKKSNSTHLLMDMYNLTLKWSWYYKSCNRVRYTVIPLSSAVLVIRRFLKKYIIFKKFKKKMRKHHRMLCAFSHSEEMLWASLAPLRRWPYG